MGEAARERAAKHAEKKTALTETQKKEQIESDKLFREKEKESWKTKAEYACTAAAATSQP